MKEGARYWFAGWAGRRFLDVLLATVRFKVMTPQPHQQIVGHGGRVIYTLWHGRLMPLTYFHRNQGIATLISQSGDGEYIARVVERWGYKAARGSSTRGGSAGLRELVRAASAGASLALTPDGPRGPRQKLKPGVLTAAQLTGSALIPMSAGTARGWWIEGWDRFLIPKPFATVFVRYGEPIYVSRSATEKDLARLAQLLEDTLNTLTDQVDADARNN